MPRSGCGLRVECVRCVSEREHSLDERGVGQGLWEVAEMGSRCGVHLFAIQAERVGVLEQRLEQLRRSPPFASTPCPAMKAALSAPAEVPTSRSGVIW